MFKPIFFSFLALATFPTYPMESDPTNFNRELFELIKCCDGRNKKTLIAGIENLIDFGADVNILLFRDTSNGKAQRTFLEFVLQGTRAVDLKRTICEVLLRKGANPNGNTSLAFAAACATGDWTIFELFINHGANIYAKDPIGKTMLHHAVASGNLAICEHLLGEGLKVNAVDNQGNTLLHIAAGNKHHELCNYLLNMGLKINRYNHTGQTPLALAAQMPNAMAKTDSIHNLDEKRDVFKTSRQICQDMVVHQILSNEKVYALLGSIKKLGAQDNEGARTLYRERNVLLQPYLQHHFLSLTKFLQDQTPYKNLVHFRAKAYKHGVHSHHGYHLPKHEYLWVSDDYCGFLLPNAMQYTQNLSRPLFTSNWAHLEIQRLHNVTIAQEPVAPVPAINAENIDNNNNIPAPAAAPAPQALPERLEPQHPAPIANQALVLNLPYSTEPYLRPVVIETPAPDGLRAALERLKLPQQSSGCLRSDRVPTQPSSNTTLNKLFAAGVIAVIAIVAYKLYVLAHDTEDDQESEYETIR